MLKLDRGFDDDHIVIGNFDSQKVVSFATIIIGGFLIIDYVPSFLRNLYNSIKSEIDQTGMESFMNILSDQVDYFDWAVAAINILIGFILVTNYRRIGNWLVTVNESKNRELDTDQ